jgi:hypothetical protein
MERRLTMRLSVRCLAIALAVASAGQLAAQERLSAADLPKIERAAAAYVAPKLRGQSFAFDARVRAKEVRSAAHSDELAKVLKAKKALKENVYRCAAATGMCSIDVDALVTIGEPAATTDGALVTVSVLELGIDKESLPVHSWSHELIVAKRDGAWTVIGVRSARAT